VRLTGENVNLSGVHGDAIKCAGVVIGFPCVDIHGKQRVISCALADTGSFSTAKRHCLLPVSKLIHHGFKFNHAIPADADQHGFGKYEDYGVTITTPDGITIVMVHHEHTYTYVHGCIYMCMCMCMCMCVYIYVYVCVYIYICISISRVCAFCFI